MYERAGYQVKKRNRRRKKRGVVRTVLTTFLKVILIMILITAVAVGVFAFARWNAIVQGAPDITGITFTPGQSATYIYDREGKREQKLALPDANREIVKLSDVPVDLQHAVVAIEDARFYEHNGIDPVGILRALVKGVTSGSFSQGASTITQQLVKNNLLTGWTQEKNIFDKIGTDSGLFGLCPSFGNHAPFPVRSINRSSGFAFYPAHLLHQLQPFCQNPHQILIRFVNFRSYLVESVCHVIPAWLYFPGFRKGCHDEAHPSRFGNYSSISSR